MSMDVGRKLGWSTSPLKADSAGSGGPGRRNQYFATPSGVTEKPPESFSGDSGSGFPGRHQPMGFFDIPQVDLGALLPDRKSVV